MPWSVLVCLALVAGDGAKPPPKGGAPQRAAYEAARKEAGGDAPAQIRLALWCERHGMTAERMEHLAAAVLHDPSNALARGLMGLVAYNGKWDKPELVAAARARAQEQQKADRHWKPILERYRAALQSKSPERRAEAEQALANLNEPDAVPMVWATLGRAQPALQKAAVQVLGQIDDGAASRALVLLAVFGGSPEVRGRAIATLRGRDAREFASMLIGMILEPIEYEVKRVRGPGQRGELLIKGQGSAPNLKRLYSPPAGPSITPQPGDIVGLDANGLPVINRPTGYMQSGWFPAGPFFRTTPASPAQASQLMGMLAHSGLGAAGQKLGQAMINAYNQQQAVIQNFPTLSSNPFVRMAGSTLYLGPINSGTLFSFTVAEGVRIPVGQMALEAQKAAAVAQRQLENDVAALEQYNQGLKEVNDRVLPVLRDVSGLDLGPKPAEWQKWYVNLIGYQLQLQASEKPTMVEDVPLAYQPRPVPTGQFLGPIAVQRVSCFGAGTLVRTLTGLEPIETLKVGDPVLAQSTKTGALAYRPIVAVHHNPPSKTFRVTLGGEKVVSSEFHRFWKIGQGWVMARDLKEGDLIRTLDGPVAVTLIERGEVMPVYNLDVAEDNDFFVGRGGVLVHDNTLPDLREKAFDAIAPLVAGAGPGRPARSMLGR